MASTNTVYTCVDYFCVTSEPPRSEDPQRGAHVLDIDLTGDSGISGQTRRALCKRVHARLADIATNDKGVVLERRIDAIRVNDAGPTPRMWTTFNELNPRHLTLIGGMSENCYFEPLRLMTTWNRLESINLTGICSPGCVFRLPPFVLRTLKTLDLNCCLDMDLRAVGGAAPTLSLEKLNIRNNDVGQSATMLLKNFPSIKRSLTCLAIHSTGCGYNNKRERTGIRRILTECKKLMEVKLTLRLHHAVDIAHFLPPDVQRLEFAAERSMALIPLIDDWVACAKVPKWAPNLRVFEFTVDREELSMPGRFFLTKIRGADENSEPCETTEEWMASLPPGVTMTFPQPQQNRELFDDYDSPSNDAKDPGFDADPDVFRYRHVFRPNDEADDLDEIDLDNLTGIGPHPDHAPRKDAIRGFLDSVEEIEDAEATYKRIQKSRSVGEEALAKFEAAFAAKKRELYAILRDTRPGIELV
ncbi:hypothetical protein D9619_006851 [Psilocybe cf. subviscida]|uniref:Uncharacterized protein n=1 Tax=Psilocybe cf. subviscida TaxID=2480587 RepID=A0A8H5B4D9_9AGAR|nr:hypothetical protein D9619_006851 [Psilocybe cf. subviscida]